MQIILLPLFIILIIMTLDTLILSIKDLKRLLISNLYYIVKIFNFLP